MRSGGADRFGKADVRGDAVAEKGVLRPLAGAVEKLRRQDNVARRVFLLQAADRGHANDPAHVQRTERIDIRAMIQLVRQKAMAAPVPRQKINLPAINFAANDRIGRAAQKASRSRAPVGLLNPSI